MIDIYLIQLTVFLMVSCIVLYVYFLIEERYEKHMLLKKISARLPNLPQKTTRPVKGSLLKFFTFIGQQIRPTEEKELQKYEKKLSAAGFRGPETLSLFWGIKLGCGVFLGLIYLSILVFSSHIGTNLIYVFFFVAAGYYIPELVLGYAIKARHDRIFKELPDVIDLLLICIEAGLSFDMAFLRVSSELTKVAPILSREFSQYFLEVQAGLPRTEVLKNLAERNGEKNLNNVVQVLLQSFKFGTDVASSLKLYSESLRKERLQKAREKSRKLSVKLAFVTILLILPAYILIVMGPTMVKVISLFGGGR
ncbi:MAG TPA: type II secretion system F family protein [Deltaproteobacteria bacterium]|nr:type II secretion system F family protein [Deltaproteobacteria bacterium]